MIRTDDLIAIDPGKTTGWAWFVRGALVQAAHADFDAIIVKPPLPARIEPNVIIECPFGRPREKDVNALISLAVMVGEFKRFYRDRVVADVELVWPTTWKGSVPKKIHNARVLKCLTPEELAVLPRRPRAKDFDNNMVDAVGIGLWKLGRLR